MKQWVYIVCVVWSLSVNAAALIEGKDYVVVAPASAVKQGKPSVTEFFNYGCPACAHLEGSLEPWVKAHQTTLDFKRVPVIFHPEWVMYAKAYYIADALGIAHKATPLLFKAIQKDNQPLIEPKEMAAFFAKNLGVEPDVADSAFTHLSRADVQMNDGMAQAAKWSVTAIPAFVVNGRYKTDLSLAKTPEHLFEILDGLSRLK